MSEQARRGPRLRVPTVAHALAAGFRNHAIRRVLLAFIGFNLAEWATWIAILVFAFRRGGAAETGLVAVVQLVPSILVAPVAASLGDRVRRETALRISYLAQALAMGATAVLLLTGAPPLAIYAGAVTAAASVTLTRPIQAAMLPSLARTPAELTAANVSGGAVETASVLGGPVLAGAALAWTGAGVVYAGGTMLSLLAALLLVGVHARTGTYIGDPHDELPVTPAGPRGALTATLEGLRVLVSASGPRPVLLIMAARKVMAGILDVMLVVLAIEVLGAGDAGVGYLNAAIGAGGVIGAMGTMLLIGRHRLAVPLVLGLALWALPLAAIGLLPSMLAACSLLAVAGIGRVVVDVAGRTLLQRVAPQRMLTRVFGILEGLDMAAMALGAAAAPFLTAALGAGGAFAAAGLAVALFTVLSWPSLVRADAAGSGYPREVALLRDIAIFHPLPPPAVERLAANLLPVEVPPQKEIVRQGEHGDRYFIITGGRVMVSIDGREVRELGPGDGFGEIALIRNVPRTATVTALDEVQLCALGRRPFLEAVTGQPASEAVAKALVDERLEARANAGT